MNVTTRRSGGRDRDGFTLVEMIVALGVGILILLAALSLADVTGTQRQLSEQQSDLISNGISVDGALGQDLSRAGRGLIAAPNLSAIHVDTATVGGAPADTLSVLWGVGEAFENSVYPCQSGASNCMAVVDQPADTLATGDLVVTGSPKTGARLLEVTAVGDPYTADCGADCSGESFACATAPDGDLEDQVVTGSNTYDENDVLLSTSPDPCDQPFWPNGDYCEEQSATSVVGVQTSSACTVSPSPTLTYRDISFTDRTGAFGYPALQTFTKLSGNDGAPQVRTRQIEFARYFLQDAGSDHPTLVKQASWDPSTSDFATAMPVAGEVQSFRVEVQHAGQASPVRGTGVTASDLAFDASTNPNFTRNDFPGSTQVVEGFTFDVSYRTIGAVRVAYQVTTRDVYEGSQELGGLERREIDLATVRATPQILGGGAGLLR